LTTIVAGETISTNALKAVIYFYTTTAICAWFRQTEVNTFLTIFARISRNAFALILIDSVNASATILAWIAMTIINIFFTIKASKAFCTLALIMIFYGYTFALILAWIG
jgi:hypothetical protein